MLGPSYVVLFFPLLLSLFLRFAVLRVRHPFKSYHEASGLVLDCRPDFLLRNRVLRISIRPQLPPVDRDARFPWSGRRWLVGKFYAMFSAT